MSLKMVISRKYKVGSKIRLEAFGDILRDWLIDWWLLVLSLVLLALGLGLILGFQLVSVESTRWTMSALVQAGAALIGIFYVALGLLWNQANQEKEKLIKVLPAYMEKISPSQGTTLKSFIQILAKSIGDIGSQERTIQWRIKECCLLLVALSESALSFLKESTTRSLQEDIKDTIGIEFSDLEEEQITKESLRIRLNDISFFSTLNGVYWYVDNIIRAAKINWTDMLAIENSVFYKDVLLRASRIDRASDSLWKLSFINYFKGKGIVIISTLWLTCLALGLFTLFALDKIPINLLPYLASLPLAIGVIAIGTTLTFGFRAMSGKK